MQIPININDRYRPLHGIPPDWLLPGMRKHVRPPSSLPRIPDLIDQYLKRTRAKTEALEDLRIEGLIGGQ